MRLDLSEKFKNLDGTELNSDSMGKVLAERLASLPSDKIKSIKAISWAMKLYQNEPIEIDQDDLASLTEFVYKAQLTPLAESQILNKLKE